VLWWLLLTPALRLDTETDLSEFVLAPMAHYGLTLTALHLGTKGKCDDYGMRFKNWA